MVQSLLRSSVSRTRAGRNPCKATRTSRLTHQRRAADGCIPDESRRVRVKDTAKTKNLEVKLPSSFSLFSLDEMENCLRAAGESLGMYMSHVTVLGRRKYPGNRHWHFKQNPKEPGCLDVTYWPDGALMWISMRNCEPSWVHTKGIELKQRMELELSSLDKM